MSDAVGESPLAASPSAPRKAEMKVLVVGFQDGIAAEQHPEIVPWCLEGWTVRRAKPRIVEKSGAQLLVVLEREAERRPAASLESSRSGAMKT